MLGLLAGPTTITLAWFAWPEQSCRKAVKSAWENCTLPKKTVVGSVLPPTTA